MSCSVCRLPFIPDLTQASSPLTEHTPNANVVPNDLAGYFKFAFGTGPRIGLKKLCYFSANMFGAVVEVDVFMWESAGGTFFMSHLVCFSLLRQALNLEDEDKATTMAFSAHELILGRPQGGVHAGRFRDVQYENVGEKVDLSPFWKRGSTCSIGKR
ncbi:hypothetical protein FB45DRAFT_1019073 [Roridomyces roridus]|uniref:Uncharacterized protein n=1 Tax=Roridomyces roridus TaxID=1738132 RepID=A0AAD7FYN5_9AGAR|nr:hypothetical protein FB45DRAFT_1019073 [Roridomyces roridus]